MSKVPLRGASVHHPGLEGGELALVFAPAATYRNNEDKLRGGVNDGAEAWASEERGRDRGGREERQKGGLIKLHQETERKQLTAVSLVQTSLKLRRRHHGNNHN